MEFTHEPRREDVRDGRRLAEAVGRIRYTRIHAVVWEVLEDVDAVTYAKINLHAPYYNRSALVLGPRGAEEDRGAVGRHGDLEDEDVTRARPDPQIFER